MQNQHYTATILVDQTPAEAFKAINNVRGWWKEEIEGNSEKLLDEFAVHFGDVHYSNQKLIEVISGAKVVWLVTDSHLSFVKEHSEWTGTKIVFEISKLGSKTEVRFSHIGLVPKLECYGGCSNAWKDYITGSLYQLITSGKGQPARDKKIPKATTQA
jgi:hypothetical protein